MRRLIIATLLVSGLVGITPRRSEATQLSIRDAAHATFRSTNDFPSLCPMLAFLADRALVGRRGITELLQDYDAILWTRKTKDTKPIVMSGIRAGAWYRGKPVYDALSWAAGPLFTFANPAISNGHSPEGLGQWHIHF